MKAILVHLGLFISLTIAAVVPDRASEVQNDNIPTVDLTVTDPERFPGKTFKGTAESIYHEMKALKPEYFVNETEPIVTATAAAMAKRQGAPIDCNWGGRIGRWFQCIEGSIYLEKLGTALCGVDAYPARARVSCSHSCGMYLYNKLDHHMGVYCKDISTDISAIANECINVFGNVHGRRDFWSHFIGLGQDSC